MQLVISVGGEGGSGVEEWAMVELQGSLESAEGGPLCGLDIGHLAFRKDGVPFLVLGHHLIQGTQSELSKPLAVMVRSEKAGEHRISALVRRKLVFKARPKPIVSNLPKAV